MSFLRSLEHSSQALHDFLDFITHSMLVVKPKDRCSMMHVASRIAQMLATCKTDESYCGPLSLKGRARYMILEFPRLLGPPRDYGRVRFDPNPVAQSAINLLSQEDYSLFEREFGVKENDTRSDSAELYHPSPPRDQSLLMGASRIRSESSAVSNAPPLNRDQSRLSGFLTQLTTGQEFEDGRPSYEGMKTEILEQEKPKTGQPFHLPFQNSRRNDKYIEGRSISIRSSRSRRLINHYNEWKDKTKRFCRRLVH